MGRSSSTPLCRTLFTSVLTGHVLRTVSVADRSKVFESPSTSPSHTGQSAGSSTTGMRSWIGAIVPFASVVTMAKLRVMAPFAGSVQLSQTPPKASSAPSTREMAKGCFSLPSRFYS